MEKYKAEQVRSLVGTYVFVSNHDKDDEDEIQDEDDFQLVEMVH